MATVAYLKPGVWSFFSLSCGYKAAQGLKPSSAALQVHKQGSGVEVELLAPEPVLLWEAGTKGRGLMCFDMVPASEWHFRLLINVINVSVTFVYSSKPLLLFPIVKRPYDLYFLPRDSGLLNHEEINHESIIYNWTPLQTYFDMLEHISCY